VGILVTTLKAFKFPLKLLTGWLREKPKKRKDKLKEKQLAHVRNFDPTRLKNKSWQIRSGKKQSKKRKNISKEVRKSKKIT